MLIENKITIKLSDDDIKEIIAEYLKNAGYDVPLDNISFIAKTKWVGYGLNEHQVTYFEGCTAVVKGE